MKRQSPWIKRLIVVPDAPLALLPFEALIVDPAQPRYLLDLEIPIVYAPSATVLFNLAERQAETNSAVKEPLLTLGDARYGDSEKTPAESHLPEKLAVAGRYGTLGGRLNPLPYTGWETKWLVEVFGTNASLQLTGENATESRFRQAVAGRTFVHLACHGLTDQMHGNYFGALALTPGSGEASDDGFLTLAEIHGLNLRSCELAVLSACETNAGPQQRGEGVWALSRAFLVAGARRVVASNWLVDDEATASLICHLGRGVAGASRDGRRPDYAVSLLHARQAVRKQKKWRSPYFWASFVLVGPE